MYKSLNLKTYLVGMTVVLHLRKIAHGKCVVFTYICCWKTYRQLQYNLNILLLYFCEKLEDIQMILQLSECLSATNICEQNKFPMCD